MDKKDLHTILYISTMKIDYSNDSIKKLLEIFTSNNKKNNISGLMLYYERNIIQCIEGSKEDVYRLYNNVENDQRHFNIIKVIDEQISKRNFINWDLAFKEISYDEFQKFSLTKLTKFISNNNNNKKILIFFKQFLESFYSY